MTRLYEKTLYGNAEKYVVGLIKRKMLLSRGQRSTQAREEKSGRPVSCNFPEVHNLSFIFRSSGDFNQEAYSEQSSREEGASIVYAQNTSDVSEGTPKS